MILHLSTAVRNARGQAIIDAIDADTNPGYIELYTGPQPAAGAAITTETLLGTLTLSKPSGSMSGGVMTLASVSDDISADADGDIAWARIYDGAGTWVADGDCDNLASSAFIKFGTLSVMLGGILEVISGSLTEGNA